MEAVYIYDLMESGFSLSRGTGVFLVIWGVMILGGLYVGHYMYKKVKPVFYVCLFLWGAFSIVEVLGYQKYLANIEALGRLEGVNLYCGEFKGFHPKSFDRIRGNVERFFVNGVEFTYDIQSTGYAYNTPFSRNAYLRPGNFGKIVSRNGEILRMEIFTTRDMDCQRDNNKV